MGFIQSDVGGLMGSVRRACDTGASIVRNRVELLTLELKEEKSRVVSAAVWGAVFVVSSFMALIAMTGTLLILFWEQRLYVAIGLLALCVIGAVTAFFLIKGGVKEPKPFAETIAQLKKDRAWLRGQS